MRQPFSIRSVCAAKIPVLVDAAISGFDPKTAEYGIEKIVVRRHRTLPALQTGEVPCVEGILQEWLRRPDDQRNHELFAGRHFLGCAM